MEELRVQTNQLVVPGLLTPAHNYHRIVLQVYHVLLVKIVRDIGLVHMEDVLLIVGVGLKLKLSK